MVALRRRPPRPRAPAAARAPRRRSPASHAEDAQHRAWSTSRPKPNRTLRHFFELATEPGTGQGGPHLRPRRRAPRAARGALRRARGGAHARVGAQRRAGVAACWLLFAAAYAVGLAWTVDAASDGDLTVGAVGLVLTLGAQLEQAARRAGVQRRLVRALAPRGAPTRLVHRLRHRRPPSASPAPRRAATEHRAGRHPARSRQLRLAGIGPPRARPYRSASTRRRHGRDRSARTDRARRRSIKLLARTVRAHRRDDPRSTASTSARSSTTSGGGALAAGFQDFVRLELLARRPSEAGDVHRSTDDADLVGALDRAVAADYLLRSPKPARHPARPTVRRHRALDRAVAEGRARPGHAPRGHRCCWCSTSQPPASTPRPSTPSSNGSPVPPRAVADTDRRHHSARQPPVLDRAHGRPHRRADRRAASPSKAPTTELIRAADPMPSCTACKRVPTACTDTSRTRGSSSPLPV